MKKRLSWTLWAFNLALIILFDIMFAYYINFMASGFLIIIYGLFSFWYWVLSKEEEEKK